MWSLSYILLLLLTSCKEFDMRRCRLLMRSFITEQGANTPYNLAISSTKVKMPAIIVVNPYSDANIGSISRVMLNFGITDLRIVSPECNILSDEARTLAVGSVELLENAKVFSSLKDSIADLNRVIVTSARPRSLNQVVFPPRVGANSALNINANISSDGSIVIENRYNVGIVFGRERNGLTNEEIAMGDMRMVIPAFEHYDVLNLAQAVNIVAYEFFQRKLELEAAISRLKDLERNKSGDQLKAIGEILHSISNFGLKDSECDNSELRNDMIDVLGSGFGSSRRQEKEKDKLASREEIFYFLDRLFSQLDSGNVLSESAAEDDDAGLAREGTPFSRKELVTLSAIYQRAKLTKGEVSLLFGVLKYLVKADSDINKEFWKKK